MLSLHYAGHDLLFLLVILVEDGTALLLTDFLHHDLLCLLCRNTSEVLRRYLDIYRIADLILCRRELNCRFCNGNLLNRVLNLFHNPFLS